MYIFVSYLRGIRLHNEYEKAAMKGMTGIREQR